MRTGILGGTFDPPHVAHLVLASEALYQLQLDRVLWVPTPNPPHKRGWDITPVHIRVDLVQAAIDGEPRFELSRVDVDRPPPHYALDTLGLLHGQHPQDDLFFLIGADSLHDLPTWHLPVELVSACDGIGVMRRPGAEFDLTRLEVQLPGLKERLRFVDAPLLEISARDIRLRASRGRPYRYLIPAGVWNLIQDYNLYIQSDSVGDAPSGSVYR
jgi:nicotinate-nucleotide adenylyltransferase